MRRASLLLLICFGARAGAEVRVASVFTDHMVLQRGTAAPIWGWAKSGEKIEVKGSWGKSARTIAAANGRWVVRIPTGPGAGGPHTLTIQGDNTLTFQDVMLGEVWLCSGQSNMEWSIGQILAKAPSDKKDFSAPNIRFFQPPNKKAQTPQETVDAQWTVCTQESAPRFSAAAFYFAKSLQSQLGAGVPVGLLQSDWGGTEVEVWVREASLAELAGFPERIATHKTNKRAWLAGDLYNGMIAPLIPYAIKGALWYQGESNVSRAYQYRQAFPKMIENWRRDWGQGDFPFYFVQIAPWTGYGNGASAELREAQLMTLKVKNTGMVVATDITDDIRDIHPANKWEVGRRFALLALNRVYGKRQIDTGPTYAGYRVEGNRIRVFFEPKTSPLLMTVYPLSGLTIAGEDRKFVVAQSQVDGNSLIVYSNEVAKPVAVRYGWSDVPLPGFSNEARLPASPFRTDNWPGITEKNVW
jgi:sialate O-acetylesterase